eukprot:1333616-Amorphochlora_amoeboformis.AAC.1
MLKARYNLEGLSLCRSARTLPSEHWSFEEWWRGREISENRGRRTDGGRSMHSVHKVLELKGWASVTL